MPRSIINNRLRISMAALGYPIDDLTDEEIEAGVQRIASLAFKGGYTCADAVKVATQLAAYGIDFRSIAWPQVRGDHEEL